MNLSRDEKDYLIQAEFALFPQQVLHHTHSHPLHLIGLPIVSDRPSDASFCRRCGLPKAWRPFFQKLTDPQNCAFGTPQHRKAMRSNPKAAAERLLSFHADLLAGKPAATTGPRSAGAPNSEPGGAALDPDAAEATRARAVCEERVEAIGHEMEAAITEVDLQVGQGDEEALLEEDAELCRRMFFLADDRLEEVPVPRHICAHGLLCVSSHYLLPPPPPSSAPLQCPPSPALLLLLLAHKAAVANRPLRGLHL
jgi:hypothetical protein